MEPQHHGGGGHLWTELPALQWIDVVNCSASRYSTCLQDGDYRCDMS